FRLSSFILSLHDALPILFVTILSWPIFSGLILSIGLSVGAQGMALEGVGTAFASVVTALLLIATAVVTPYLAAHMVGGTMKNIAQQGLDAATARVRSVHRVIVPSRAARDSQTKPSSSSTSDESTRRGLVYGTVRRSQSCCFPAELRSSHGLGSVCPPRRLEELGPDFPVLRNSPAYPGEPPPLAKAARHRGRCPRRK